MNITINIRADDIPSFTEILSTDELKEILGIKSLKLDSVNFSSELGNDKSVYIEYIQINPEISQN